jgi:formylmethanofuran dehydrogenase subunit C
MKGGTMIINGSVGDLAGENLYGGDILITGDAGMGVGDNMLGGTIYVNGKLNSLGKGTKLLRLNKDDRLKLTSFLTEQNMSGEFKFRKVVAENEVPFSILEGLLGIPSETLKKGPDEEEEQIES